MYKSTNKQFSLVVVLMLFLTIASYLTRRQFNIHYPIVNIIGFIFELIAVGSLGIWSIKKRGTIKTAGLFLSLFFLFFFLGNSSFYYFYYYKKTLVPTLLDIRYPVVFYKICNVMNIAAVLLFIQKGKVKQFFFNKTLILSLLISAPVIFRFSEPILLNESILGNPLMLGIEIFGIVGSFLIFNMSFLILLSSGSLFWSVFSSGQLIYIITGWSIKLERLLYGQQKFVSYEYVFSFGILLCASSVFFLNKEKLENFFLRPFDSNKLVSKGRLFILIATFLAIVLISLAEVTNYSVLQFFNVSSAVGIILSTCTGLIISDSLSDFSKNLKSLIKEDKEGLIKLTKVGPTELIEIFSKFVNYKIDQTQKIESAKNKEMLSAQRLEICRQVAHDIKSPLAALSMVVSDLGDVDSGNKKLFRAAYNRIEDITNELLLKERSSNLKRSYLFSEVLDSIISEKRAQYKDKLKIKIIRKKTNDLFGVFVNIHRSNFDRAISNIINNSVEALPENTGVITIDTSISKGYLKVEIKDNGMGMSNALKDALLSGEKLSHGKDSSEKAGSGRGLSFAKWAIETDSGKISISSEVQKGTIVTVQLPISPRPSWFYQIINLVTIKDIIVIDDEFSIHELWKSKILGETCAQQAVKLHNFSSIREFKESKKINELNPESTLFLIDFELRNDNENGLQFIKSHKIAERSVLVTSHFDDQVLINNAIESNISILPKNLILSTPINPTPKNELNHDRALLSP